jgi:hypothetical protein
VASGLLCALLDQAVVDVVSSWVCGCNGRDGTVAVRVGSASGVVFGAIWEVGFVCGDCRVGEDAG